MNTEDRCAASDYTGMSVLLSEVAFLLPFGTDDDRLQEAMRNRERVQMRVNSQGAGILDGEFEILNRVDEDGCFRYTVRPASWSIRDEQEKFR